MPISCASILAKEEHDKYINELCDQYPDLEKYGLRSNVGYGSAQHKRAIDELGITQFHRKSYKPCQNKKMNHVSEISNLCKIVNNNNAV